MAPEHDGDESNKREDVFSGERERQKECVCVKERENAGPMLVDVTFAVRVRLTVGCLLNVA